MHYMLIASLCNAVENHVDRAENIKHLQRLEEKGEEERERVTKRP